MEEAYSELYEQYLRLRSLCLRQAALLHQLTTALQKQQGSTVPNGESDMMSIPIQCTQEIPACLLGNVQPLTAKRNNPAAQCGVGGPSRNVGIFSDLLAEDMSKLCVDMPPQRKEEGNLEQKVAPLISLDSYSRWQGAPFNVTKNLGQADHLCGDRTMHTAAMPVTDNPNLVCDFLNPSGGMLMSDVALHSHVCEFCQAVFPGDTTTRGEFLRHLHTHVT
uniref:uncharacterized protein n=1 Tax=Semicossyphus pulcher TaxID=241346 RepID=UPI0037E759CB